MLGAIIGDAIGSVYEFDPIKTKTFDLFGKYNEITDDSLLTMAVFVALEKCKGDYSKLSKVVVKELIQCYANCPNPMGGYGSGFVNWAISSLQNYKVLPPYNSYGNGAAMRISPVAYFATSLEECRDLSYKITVVTHNHEEGIKGAEATAVAIYMALNGYNKKEIREHINSNYYTLKENCNTIRKNYGFESSCQETVPQSIQAFLDSTCYEDAIRIVVSLGGDADTMGAITGALAEAYYGISKRIEKQIYPLLDQQGISIVKRMITLRDEVAKRYLESENSRFGSNTVHSRVSGSDMDGNPDKTQFNAAIKLGDTRYVCKDGAKFLKIDAEEQTEFMNADDFQVFVDEIRLFLHRRFKSHVRSIEDFYEMTFLKWSMSFWS